ncbi:MAG: high frequency lysogenization protein HflD [Gammaproteobacteria bacterium]|nr:high frequency lysogenization protein HflD [Gammaproteobacteria bacterium]
MSDNKNNQVLAFAAMCQCAQLVHNIARTGTIDNQQWQVCVNSLVITDPENATDIYSSSADLFLGFKTLIAQLSDNNDNRSVEVTKYVAGLIALERKLMKSPKSLAMMSQRVDQVKRQLHHFTVNDPAVIANFASIYSDIISPLGSKIQISGVPEQLQQKIIQEKIRALLLAGIRAAVLWRQMGGKRRHLLLARKELVTNAQQQLNRI